MTRARWFVAAVATACLILTVIVGPFTPLGRIEGLAMAPALGDQDRVLINRWAYLSSSPERGDVVMLRYPRDERKAFVKRVIARGGDTLRIEDGLVYVNDRPVDESYVAQNARSHESLATQVIPEGHYFVMGDRRNNSADSRHWGLVHEDLIVGRVSVRLWPSPSAVE
jgi:signal peptidase I